MDTLFFLFSKLAWALIAPGTFLVLLLLAGTFLLFAGRLRAGKVLVGIPACCFLIIACLPVGEWLAWPLEARFPPEPELPAEAKGIIVLGGALMGRESVQWDQPQVTDAAERNLALLWLARRFPDAALVFSGGSGRVLQQDIKEADIAAGLFNRLGLPAEKILFERNSRNTYENAVNSRELTRPESGENWILVTSAAHMPRSVGIFCRLGWPVIPYPVDFNTSPESLVRLEFDFSNNLEHLTAALREWVGLIVYYLMGKTDTLLPAGCEAGTPARQ